jgi:hypothetical protein
VFQNTNSDNIKDIATLPKGKGFLAKKGRLFAPRLGDKAGAIEG